MESGGGAKIAIGDDDVGQLDRPAPSDGLAILRPSPDERLEATEAARRRIEKKDQKAGESKRKWNLAFGMKK